MMIRVPEQDVVECTRSGSKNSHYRHQIEISEIAIAITIDINEITIKSFGNNTHLKISFYINLKRNYLF